MRDALSPRVLVLLFVMGSVTTLVAQTNISFETYSDTYKTDLGPVLAGDFNNDGKPDLVECCNNPGTQLVFRAGNGDGTFQAPVVAFSTAVSLQSAVVADVNG